MKLMETFWDSECARFGDTGATGFEKWYSVTRYGGDAKVYSAPNAPADPDVDTSELVPMVVDPDVVFGEDTSLRTPAGFTDVDEMAARGEVKVSKTPCAFALAKRTLAPGASVTLYKDEAKVSLRPWHPANEIPKSKMIAPQLQLVDEQGLELSQADSA